MSKNGMAEETLQKQNLLLEGIDSKLNTIILILRKISQKNIKEGKKNGI